MTENDLSVLFGYLSAVRERCALVFADSGGRHFRRKRKVGNATGPAFAAIAEIPETARGPPAVARTVLPCLPIAPPQRWTPQFDRQRLVRQQPPRCADCPARPARRQTWSTPAMWR